MLVSKPGKANRARVAGAAAFAIWVIAAFASATLPAGGTVFPAQGGKGDRAEEYRCPAGYVLSGFHGQTGAWIDQIGLICSEVLADMRLGRVTRLHVKGGIGGSPTEQYCVRDAGIREIRARLLWKFVMGNSRFQYVHTIQFTCARPRDGSPAGGGAFKGTEPGDSVNFPEDLNPSWRDTELCPGNEYATGLNIRYGGHVNAVGLICATLAPAEPPKVIVGDYPQVTSDMEVDTDRPGSDYKSFPIEAGKPAVCKSACWNERPRCRAWTYVRPGLQGPKAMCHLKEAKPSPKADTCCISGALPGATDGGGTSDPGGVAPASPSTGGKAYREPGGFSPAPSHPPQVTPPVAPPAPYPSTPPNGGAVAQDPGGFARVPISAGCAAPFVQRKARPGDTVCVTRQSFATVQDENATAPSRWNPNGAYGPNTCVAGYVWREAFDGDTVCVTPARRAEVKEESRLAPTRAAAQEQPFKPSRTSPGALGQGGGVKPVISPPETNTDRPGSDYESYRMDDAHPCRAACVGDKRCQAWTFVRAGIHGPTGMCYLKRPAPAPVPNTCCTSGTVTR